MYNLLLSFPIVLFMHTHITIVLLSIVLLLCLQHMHITYPFPSTRTYAHVCSRTIDAHVRARTVRSRRRALAKLRLALVNARRHYQILFSTIVCVFFSIVSIPGTPAGYSSRILFDIISGYSAQLLTFGEVTMETRHGRIPKPCI